MTLKLPRIEVRVLSQQCVTALREAILSGDLPPGHRLVEAELAQQIGVSRAPVREAIRHLEQEGLVEIFPHRGAVVVGVSEQEIEAAYVVRAAIEEEAFDMACARITPQQCDQLRDMAEQMGRHADRRETAELIEKDLEFHRLVLEVSGYTVLRRVWDRLDGIMRVRTLQAIARPNAAAQQFLKATVSAHLELLDALEQNDPSRARRLVHDHIVGVAKQIKTGASR